MGKKIKAEMDEQRARPLSRAAPNTSDRREAKANELFDLIDKFAGYGFNKSHAAAYALLAYQTAWLKAHYPADFFAGHGVRHLEHRQAQSIFADDMRRWALAAAAVHQSFSRPISRVER
jgi:DNA polymerase-3 subunit alpha